MRRKAIRGLARKSDVLIDELIRIGKAVRRFNREGSIPEVIARKLEDAETSIADASYYLDELASLKK